MSRIRIKVVMSIPIVFILVGILMLLTGCGNMNIIDWHWTFDEAIVKMPDGKCEKIKLVGWHDFEKSDMIQIETEEQVFCTHSANVILIKNKKEKR